MTAEEPLIDLFIQPAKHPYFVKEKSLWTVDRATSLTQRGSRSSAQHSRSFACQLPSVGRSPLGDKPVDNGSLPSRLFSASSDGVCAAGVSPQAVVAADDRSCFSGSLSTPVVQSQQAAERRSPQRRRGLPFLGVSGPSVAHETLATNGDEGKELKHRAKAGEPRAAVTVAAATAATTSSPEAVGAATTASTSGSNNLAFLTESIRRKKNNRWHTLSPVDGKDSIKLLSGRGSPLAADDTVVAAATRGAFYNPGYDAWPDEDAVVACRSSPFVDVECATEASENSAGCAANLRRETRAFVFRRPSTSSVETTVAPGARDAVSLSGSSCHEDDIQPLSLVLHVAEEPYVSNGDADCVVSTGSGGTGAGLPSLTRRLFARHKRDGSARSGRSSSSGRIGGCPSRYHRDSGRSAAAATAAPSRPKPSASKGSRDAAGCGADRIAAHSCDGADGDVAAILTPSSMSSLSAASCWPTPPQSLNPTFVPAPGSARTTLLRSRSRSPSSYSCSSSRLLSDRVAADVAAASAVAAAATPPRNPSYGSIDSLAYGVPSTLRAGALSTWYQQRQQHQAESSFFDVVVAEPVTVGTISSRRTYPPIGRASGSTVASSGAPAARQSIVLRHLEQFDFEESCDDDFRGDRGSRVIGARKTERRRRQRRVLIAVALFLALILTAGAVAAYLILSGSQLSRGSSQVSSNDSFPPSTEHSILSTSPPNQARYVGTILLKIDYTPDMADLSSQTARNVTSRFCDAVKSMYSANNSTNMIYDNCEVTKLERGSVKVTFKITFTSKTRSVIRNDTTTASRLRLVLEDEIKTTKFGSFPCDVTNFSMELELGESVQSQRPTALPPHGDDDVSLDPLVSEANGSIAAGLTGTSTIGLSSHRDEIEVADMLGIDGIGVDDVDWLATTTTNGASSTQPAVSRYFLTGDRDETALHLTETTNVQRLLEDDATMRRRFDLTPVYDSAAVAATSLPTILATADTTRVVLPLNSQFPMKGVDRTTPEMTTSGLSAAATQAGFTATATAAAPITMTTQQLPGVTEQHGKWLRTEAVASGTAEQSAVTSDREEASEGHTQAELHNSSISLSVTIAASAVAGGAAMASGPSELLTSDPTSSAVVDYGRQLSTHSVPTATVLPTMIASSAVFSPTTPFAAASMIGTPEPTSHDAVSPAIVVASAAAAASMMPVLTITSATSFETARPAFELLSESQLTSLATYRIYERTSARKHVTSVTSSGSSSDSFLPTSPVVSASLFVPQTDSETDHTGHDAVSPKSPLPALHVISTIVPPHSSDGASAAPFGTSRRSTYAEPVETYGSVTAGIPEMHTVDTATPSSEVLSRTTSSSALLDTVTSSSALLDTVGVSVRAQNLTSAMLQTGTTSVPNVSPARSEVVSSPRPVAVTSPHSNEPRPRPDDSGTSTAAALSSLETSMMASQPARGAHASIAEERMATTSSTLTSLASAASVASTTLLNRSTASVVQGTPASQAASTDAANVRSSLTTTFFIGGVQPAARTNGSDSAIVPLPSSQRVATTVGAAFTLGGSTAVPAFGGTSSTEESASGAAISGTTNRYSFGCGVNESYVRPSSHDCRTYKLCDHGSLMNLICAAGLYFEPLRNICVPCNVSRCNKCPISRMERAGDSGTARAVVAAVPTGPEKGGIGTPATASGVSSGRSWGSAATPISTVDTMTAIVNNLRLARTSPLPDLPPAAHTSGATGSLFAPSAAAARPQQAAAGHASQALSKPISSPPHVTHHLATSAVQLTTTPALTATLNVVAVTTIAGGTLDRHTAAATVTLSSLVTGESTVERRDVASVASFADQQQTSVAHASPCSSDVFVADPDDCTAMIYCMSGGNFVREPCEDAQMFSAPEGMCVACDITVCNKCAPST